MVATGTHESGRSVLRSLEDGLQQARRQSGQLRSELETLDQAIRELVDRRGQRLTELAQHYLPAMTHDNIRQTFHAIRDDLMQILQRKELREKQLQEEWNALVEERHRREQELEDVTDELNSLVARREQLEAQVAERLQQEQEFQELTAKIVATDEELHRNERRVDEITQEAAGKLPAYNRSRLFQYLYKRQYGTPQYRAGGLFRRWDRWIAGLIDYPRARRSYDFLRTTPARMAEEVERRRQELADLMQQAESIERRIADELGLTEVLRHGEAVGSRRDELVAELERTTQQAEGVDQELLALQSSQNEYYEQAIAWFRQFLASMEESALEACTKATPDTFDDRVLAEIRQLDDQLDDLRRRSESLNSEFRAWDAKVGGLELVVRQFRAAEFDSQRSQFPRSFDVRDALAAFLEGRSNQQELWTTLRQHQQFAPLWYEEPMRHGGDVMNSDFSQVLLEALTQAARHAAHNPSYGRTIHRGRFPRHAGRSSIPRSMPRPAPRPRPGGFTSGRGF